MVLWTAAVAAALAGAGICLGTGAFQNYSWLWMLPLCFAGLFLALVGAAFGVFYLVCRRVDLDTPQEHDDLKFRRAAKPFIDAILGILMTRITVEGVEKMPKDGRFLLVCNHLSLLDPLVMLSRLSRFQLSFISKKENRDMPIVGAVMHRSMCQMIDRENDREALKSIIRCIRLLKEDEVNVVVFPEGYTSQDGHLQHFRSGVFKIALKAEVPIVVCTLEGTEKVLSYGDLVPKNIHFGKSVRLRVAEVLPYESLRGKTAVQIGQEAFEIMAANLCPANAPLSNENPG